METFDLVSMHMCNNDFLCEKCMTAYITFYILSTFPEGGRLSIENPYRQNEDWKLTFEAIK